MSDKDIEIFDISLAHQKPQAVFGVWLFSFKTAKWYAEADLKQLYNASKASMKGNKRLMIFDRNDLMAQRIAAMAAENTVCAAIGAGHLWGEKGVLNQLKKMGFIVEPN